MNFLNSWDTVLQEYEAALNLCRTIQDPSAHMTIECLKHGWSEMYYWKGKIHIEV